MKTIVKPNPEHQQRLIENIGRDSWVYADEPTTGVVEVNGTVIDVWCFDFDAIELRVRQHMIRDTIKVRGMTAAQARGWLRRVGVAIACDDITLEIKRE